MKNRGKLVILVMLTAGLVAAIFAWRHQHRQGTRVLQLWGPEVTYQIRLAPRCELLQLNANLASGVDQLRIANQPWAIESRRDISQARGLVHARQALIQDASYAWEAPLAEVPQWTAALVFSDPDLSRDAVILAIDPERGDICDVNTDRRGHIGPISDGLKKFLNDVRNEQAAE